MTTALRHRLAAALAADPGAVALVFKDESWTWADFARTAEQLNDSLSALGIGPHEGVGLVLRNSPAHLATLIGLVLHERTVLIINPLLPPDILENDLAQLRAKVVCAAAKDLDREALRVGCAQAGSHLLRLPDLRAPGTPKFETVPSASFPAPVCAQYREPTPGIAIEMLTSGTTGPPKRIPLNADALDRTITRAAVSNRSGVTGDPTGAAPNLIYTPLVHIGGLFFVFAAVVERRPIVLHERFNVGAWRDAVKHYQLTSVGLVPTALRAILRAKVPPEDLASLQSVRCGTAPITPEEIEDFERTYGIPVLTNYGATEFSGAVASWTLADRAKWGSTKRGSAGRAREGCFLRIVDEATGLELPRGSTGLLEVLATQTGPQWIRTNDLASIDDDGFLYIKGRADNVIIRGGFKIHPDTVANVLRQHLLVADAAVGALADPRLGEVPVALIECVPGGPSPSPSQLEAHCRAHLKPYEKPVGYIFGETIPRTASLKVSRLDLERLLNEAEKSGRIAAPP